MGNPPSVFTRADRRRNDVGAVGEGDKGPGWKAELLLPALPPGSGIGRRFKINTQNCSKSISQGQSESGTQYTSALRILVSCQDLFSLASLFLRLLLLDLTDLAPFALCYP